MIACFAVDRELSGFQLSPRKMFKKISSRTDLDGIHFTGILVGDVFYSPYSHVFERMHEAYEALRIKQPELFENKL